jgi:anti-sigma factor RsiW
MGQPSITNELLLLFLQDRLSDMESARIERTLREDPELHQRFVMLRAQIDLGEHSVSGIWRRERISCLTDAELCSAVLGTLDPQLHEYLMFHVETLGCTLCRSIMDDAQQQMNAPAPPPTRSQTLVKKTREVLKNATGT